MVKNIFSILTIRQTSILSGAVVIMATVMLSKILGLIRDRLLAHTFTPDTVAIFFAAFRLPDLIFQLLILGALSVAFVPVFSPEQRLQVALLTRIILIGQIILTVGSFFIGMLQSFQRFIVPALAGVFYNFGIILGIIFFSSPFGIMGPAIGVIIGAILHSLIQLPLILSL